MSSIAKLTDRFTRAGIRTVAVVDLQWGDAGKGKLVDCLAEWADVVARGTGGANAGHTIILGNEVHVFHLIPSGILWDGEGKLNVIGRGVAVEPRILSREIRELEKAGKTCKGLRVSCHAPLVLPFDIALDQLREAGRGASVIGTTGRGIGPAYESRVARIGLSVNDLLNKGVFAEKVRRNLDARLCHFRQFDPELVSHVLESDALENGAFRTSSGKVFDTDAIVERYLLRAETFRDAIMDTDALMQTQVGCQRRVLLEGAQGVLLSVAYGSYPYVTSSDCSLAGLAEGVGLRTEHVDHTLGVVKAPYMSRVGKGPFPTELGGEQSADWCTMPEITKDREREEYPEASVNSSDPFLQGVATRQLGDEYGATTGRLRRVGWLDLPLLRYAIQFGSTKSTNGRSTLALTKVDVMSSCMTIKLCMHHLYKGEKYQVGSKKLLYGTPLLTAIMDSFVLERCEPVYREFPGWCCDLRGIRSWADLPNGLRDIILEIERHSGVTTDVLSIGADRDATVVF